MSILEEIRATYLERVGVPLALSDDELVARIQTRRLAKDPAVNAPNRITRTDEPPEYHARSREGTIDAFKRSRRRELREVQAAAISPLVGYREDAPPNLLHFGEIWYLNHGPEFTLDTKAPRAKTMAEVQAELEDGEPTYSRTG
jgi:hypothetical protein